MSNWFHNLKIRGKLTVGFGVMLLLLIAVTWIGLDRLNRSTQMTKEMTKQHLPALVAAVDIPEAVRTIQRDLRDALLLQDPKGIAKWNASYSKAGQKLAAKIKDYATYSPTTEGRENAEKLKTASEE